MAFRLKITAISVGYLLPKTLPFYRLYAQDFTNLRNLNYLVDTGTD